MTQKGFIQNKLSEEEKGKTCQCPCNLYSNLSAVKKAKDINTHALKKTINLSEKEKDKKRQYAHKWYINLQEKTLKSFNFSGNATKLFSFKKSGFFGQAWESFSRAR